jgi:hypothetical protein
MELHNYSGRNVIAYYSGFLSKPKIEGIEITDEDKNGFMLCIHKLDRIKGLDLMLHTPGGNLAATQSLVNYLRQMFGSDIRAFIPQIAMSAGTMVACACKEIVMGKHSNLGPVDPQINGIPAYAVLAEMETAYHEIVANTRKAAVWNPILSKYPPSFVQLCQWGIDRSEQFVSSVLKEAMFADPNDVEQDLRTNKGHDQHIHFKECKEIGLNVVQLEDDKKLQDLVLTVHHCYMHTLANTSAFKIVENHVGRAFVKVQQQHVMMVQQQPPASPAPSGPTH